MPELNSVGVEERKQELEEEQGLEGDSDPTTEKQEACGRSFVPQEQEAWDGDLGNLFAMWQRLTPPKKADPVDLKEKQEIVDQARAHLRFHESKRMLDPIILREHLIPMMDREESWGREDPK